MANLFGQSKAFSVFFDDVCAVSGTRLENGKARALSLSIKVCLTGPTSTDAVNGASAAQNEQNAYCASVRFENWPDHLPPQIGDVWRISDDATGELHCVSVLKLPFDWLITLRGA